MAVGGYRLGIDFGTSTTVAVLAGPDGRAKPMLFDASPLLPSSVFAGPDGGQLLTGADAERAGLAHPGGLESNPKRRINDGVLWLGERECGVVDVVAAVLARVAVEAQRVVGGTPDVVLTHPAGWGRSRLGILAAAAGEAKLSRCRFVAEPVAAAAYFADVLDQDLPAGRYLVVYDLGAGTCDVSAVRRTPTGLEVVASAGLDDVGGVDLDAVVVGHARSSTAADPDAWSRLDWPRTAADRQARQQLWRGARAAKEQLSRHSTADLHVPLVDTVVHLTREEFEDAARPLLAPTVDLTVNLLRGARIPSESIAAVFLVGGASRVPLAASLLHRGLRIAPIALDHPELVVAEGALRAPANTVGLETDVVAPPVPDEVAPSFVPVTVAEPPPLSAQPADRPAAHEPTTTKLEPAPPPANPFPTAPPPSEPAAGRRRVWLVAIAIVLGIFAVAVLLPLWNAMRPLD